MIVFEGHRRMTQIYIPSRALLSSERPGCHAAYHVQSCEWRPASSWELIAGYDGASSQRFPTRSRRYFSSLGIPSRGAMSPTFKDRLGEQDLIRMDSVDLVPPLDHVPGTSLHT